MKLLPMGQTVLPERREMCITGAFMAHIRYALLNAQCGAI
jgi:hypothetical protein